MPSSDPKELAQHILRSLTEHGAERASSSGPPEPPDATRIAADPFILGYLAVKNNLLRPDQLEECLKEWRESQARGERIELADLILKRGWATPEAIAGLKDEPQAAPAELPSFARFEIRERLGEGASAVVYRAWDRNLHRWVALKVLRKIAELNDVARERFRREAQASAGLVHPHVVTVYDAGEEKGQFYLVMELVEGKPLSDMLREGKLSQPELLRLLEKVARGVAAAHERGIVHRDLKPANLLVTASTEPKVGDFGLAHLTDGQTALTRTGTTLGTPLYMSPEQVEGRSKEVTPRTDVYALGAILYEILTGRPPHQGEVTMELYKRIVEDSPVSPSRVRPGIALEAEAIALKALSKEPGRRYPTAREFADDLGRYLSGEPVQARPPGLLYRSFRKIRRHRAAVAVGISLSLAAGILVLAVRESRMKRPETDAYAGIWRSAMSLASGRDYDAALRRLEESLPSVHDSEVHREALQDVDLLNQVKAMHSDALRRLTNWPVGQKVSLEYWDKTGVPTRIDQPLVRATSYQLELERETVTVLVDFGEITAPSLVQVYLGRPAPRREEEWAGPALLCLLEGEFETARNLIRGSVKSIPEKYWVYSKTLSRARSSPAPETLEKERTARRLFYTAESDYRNFQTRFRSARQYASLRDDYSGTDFVRRNRSFLESRQEAGKEFFFTFSNLAAAGGFKRSYQTGVEWCWASGPDSERDPPRRGYLDIDFSALPNTPYRCWVYIGGCCAETLSFSAQGTDWVFPDPQTQKPVPMEPGKPASRSILQNLVTAPQTHLSHSGSNQSARWGWTEVALPKYPSAGPKTVRLLPAREGFYVAHALVSSVRDFPLGEVELKERVRESVAFRSRWALWIDAAWSSAEFHAPMTQGKLYSEGSLSGSPVYAAVDNRKFPEGDVRRTGSAVALRPDRDDGGWVTYVFEIPKDGPLFLWARLYYPGGLVLFPARDGMEDDPNSFYVSVDGGNEKVLGNLSYHPQKLQSYFRRWHWDGDSESRNPHEPAAMALGQLSRGTHTLRIRNREAVETAEFPLAPRLDMICLTPDPAYVPRDDDVRR
jgi:serine/threonine protein kinase